MGKVIRSFFDERSVYDRLSYPQGLFGLVAPGKSWSSFTSNKQPGSPTNIIKTGAERNSSFNFLRKDDEDELNVEEESISGSLSSSSPLSKDQDHTTSQYSNEPEILNIDKMNALHISQLHYDYQHNGTENQERNVKFISQSESGYLYVDMMGQIVQNCSFWNSTNETDCSSGNNGTYYDDLMDMLQEPIQFSLGFQIIIYILYNMVFIAAVIGNVLVCYVVFSSPRMRTVTNYLIFNLAVGDLLMAVLCVPFSYIPVLLQYWPFGQFLCYVVTPAQAVCVFVSAYTLVVLAGDRYVAILYPLKPRLRKSQALVVIAMVWFIAVITAAPIFVFTRLEIDETSNLPLCVESGWMNDTHKLVYSLTLMILQYFFPLGVLIFTYTRIAIEVWGKKAPGEAEDGRDQRLAKAKRKTVVMSLAVVAGYTLAWLPINLYLLLSDLGVTTNLPYIPYIFFVIHWLAMAHTTYNPLIYAWINSRFRSAFQSVLAKVHCRCHCCPCQCQDGDSSPVTRATFCSRNNTTRSHHNSQRAQQLYLNGDSRNGSPPGHGRSCARHQVNHGNTNTPTRFNNLGNNGSVKAIVLNVNVTEVLTQKPMQLQFIPGNFPAEPLPKTLSAEQHASNPDFQESTLRT